MKFIKDHYVEIITYAICIVFTIAIIAFGMWLTKVIWTSDLPEWLKIFLIAK